MRSLADELDDAEDEITGQAQIHVNGGTVVVGETGRFSAVETPTRPDNPSPPSDPPKVVKSAVSFLGAVKGWPQALVGLGVLALIGFYLWLTNR